MTRLENQPAHRTAVGDGVHAFGYPLAGRYYVEFWLGNMPALNKRGAWYAHVQDDGTLDHLAAHDALVKEWKS